MERIAPLRRRWTAHALAALPALLCCIAPSPLASQGAVQAGAAPSVAGSHPIEPPAKDETVETIVRDVSPRQIEHTIRTLVGFGNRSTLSSMDRDLPAGHGVNAARDWIEGEFERYSQECGGCLEVKRDTFTEQPQNRIPRPTEITNVYAVLRGTDPVQAKRVYLVTGHYDSRNSTNENTRDAAPGANDDASGTAVSLECARVLSRHKFPATLIFLTVAGEEQGLNGSRHFAKMFKETWGPQGYAIAGALNDDIVGGNTTPGDTEQRKDVVRVFSEGVPVDATPEQVKRIQMLGGANDSQARQLARYIRLTTEAYLPSFRAHPVFRLDRYLRGGDHLSFSQQGYPAVRFTEWREDFNHQHQNVRVENGVQYGDLPQFVDFDYVANVARVNALTLASLALAPGTPQDPRLLTTELTNDTTLAWQPPAGAGLDVRYEVVWRDTEAPFWQQAKPVGTETRVTLPLSKDNVIFGVRAVDAKGHRSPVVVPSPAR